MAWYGNKNAGTIDSVSVTMQGGAINKCKGRMWVGANQAVDCSV